MEIKNMKSGNRLDARSVPNQFIITERGGWLGNFIRRETFQSYATTIAVRTFWMDETETKLDKRWWKSDSELGKYRNMFLGETTRETEKKIKSGEYKLADLNKS